MIFDRRLRTPPDARVLSTRDAGPVIIVTTAARRGTRGPRSRLEARGAEIEVAPDGTLRRGARARSASAAIGSLLLEGGAALHAAAWDEGWSISCGSTSRRTCSGRAASGFSTAGRFRPAALVERRVEPLGPDVLIEGYVHGPR